MRLADALPTPARRGPVSPRALRRRLLEHVRLPLHRDGYALAVNSAFTAVTGLFYWILAAKTYSAHAVGVNSALISSMMFLAGIASLNLPNIVIRFLPESGERTRSRVAWAYALSGVLALCAAAVFIVGVSSFAPRLNFLRSNHGLQAWFLFSTLAWCLFVIQDSVLTALGRAVWVPIENAVFSILKLGLLAAAAALTPRYGIFVSWTIAMLASVIGVNLIIFARLVTRVSGRPGQSVQAIRDRAFGRYFAADYLCSIAWLSTANLMPVIVTAAAGPTTNAYWALAYAVALPFYALGLSIATSLMLHGAANRSSLTELTRKAALQGFAVLVPCVALVALLAPQVLSLFGATYAHHSAMLLRLLVLSSLPYFVLSLALSAARIKRRLRRAVIVLWTEALLALGLATPLLHAAGVTGVGYAWLLAEGVGGLVVVLTWRAWFRDDTAAVEVVDGRAEAGQQRTVGDEHDPSGGEELHPVLRGLFGALEQRRLRWALLRVPSHPAAPTGDVDLLVAPEDAEAFAEAAASVGFVALPGWRSPPDLILVCYDRPSDRWLVLDVSTTVSFRSPRSWELEGAAAQVLQRRQLRDGMTVPDDGDAFWLLLLHCLLDKRRLAPYHRARLRRLASAGLESPVGAAACAIAGSEFAPGAFVRAARSGDWQALAELGGRFAAELERRRPIRERLAATLRGAVQLLRKPLLLPRRRGVSIALLGSNGVGKSTVAAGLQWTLPFEARVVYMGIWSARVATRNPVVAAAEVMLRPARIWLRYLVAQYHQLRGRLVIFDRYVYEAMLPAQPPLVLAKRVYFWFLAHALPDASAVVVLDVPGEVAYQRKQENPPEELDAERRVYAQLAGRIPALQMVDAAADPDTVRAEITGIVWRAVAARWQGAPSR